MGSCFNAAMEVKRKIDNAVKDHVSFSGGKDSTAMLYELIKRGYNIDSIDMADTLFEFFEMYVFIKRVEEFIGREINLIKPPQFQFEELINKNNKIAKKCKKLGVTAHIPEYPTDWKEGTMISLWDFWFYGLASSGDNMGLVRGYPLQAFPCWYSREAKIKPLQKVMVDAKNIYVGIAADELDRVGKDEFVKYPLVDWGMTEQDCADLLNKIGLMNPLYKNWNRLGCMHCQKQNEAALFALWKTHRDDGWALAKHYDEESRRVTGGTGWRLISKKDKDGKPIKDDKGKTIKELKYLTIAPHGMKDNPIVEYEEKFASGWQPKGTPKYGCDGNGCDAVRSAFQIRQTKINAYFESKKEVEKDVCSK